MRLPDFAAHFAAVASDGLTMRKISDRVGDFGAFADPP
jgi:hypothetical protein